MIVAIGKHARAALAWSIPRSWGGIVTTIALAMVVGDALTLGTLFYYHKLITVRNTNCYPAAILNVKL